MTYSFRDDEDPAESQQNARSANRMAALILVLAVVWVLGAAVMFTAAIKGSTLSSASAAASATSAPAPTDTTDGAPAAPAAQ